MHKMIQDLVRTRFLVHFLLTWREQGKRVAPDRAQTPSGEVNPCELITSHEASPPI